MILFGLTIELLHWHYWIGFGVAIIMSFFVTFLAKIPLPAVMPMFIWPIIFAIILYFSLSIILMEFGVGI